MLNTQKLLYILPDVAYVAELLPGKKEHTFTVQAFRQINGEFIDEDENFIAENIEKLFSKIEPETYHLIVPDFLFTNTILDVNDTNESKVKQQIKDELLPKLEITKDSHEIETFSLTTYNGVTKIQLTALEKSVLDPIVVAANAHKVTIEHISPLTWTIKSVISLEPSISVLQIGSMVYVAQHYIGVDQCSFSKVDEIENVAEAIKTLKGTQPSIQTVYLLTNQLVEEKLKEHLSNILPLQQLSSAKEGDDQMPSYVKHIIESGMKTLDIPDFPVPSFGLPKAPQGEVNISKTSGDDDIEEVEAPVLVPPVAPKTETPPEAKPLEVDSKTETKPDDEPASDSDDEDAPVSKPSTPVAPAIIVPPAAGAAISMSTPSTEESEVKSASTLESAKAVEPTEPAKPITTTAAESLDDEPKTAVPETGSSVKDDDATIASLAGHHSDTGDITEAKPTSTAAPSSTSSTTPDARPVIKNKAEGGNLMKMAFVSLTVFALTVAIGIGIGYGWLSLNKKEDPAVTTSAPSPSPVASLPPVATQSASPSASASASIDKATFKILVVNATTTPGYAGTTSNKLKAAGFTQVTAGNAQGDYEPGFYILLAQNNPSTVSTLSEASDLDLTYQSGKTTEDPSNQYDAVIVLAE